MIAAQVYRFTSGSFLECQDYWRFTGIHRDVFLWSAPKTQIRDYFFTTDLDDTYMDARARVEIDLSGPELSQGKLDVRIMDKGQIVAEMIREQALRQLDKEIPHGIAVVIDRMKERPDGSCIDIEATIICERDSHKGIIIGKQGAMLKKIGTKARISMENLLDMKVNLKLWVKVKKDWRDSDTLLRNYGYREEN